MKEYTKEDILRMVEEEDVEFVRMQFTDIFGNLKNLAITVSQLERALDGKCVFDGSALEGFMRIEEADMVLKPDLSTFVIFPWRPQQGKVARLLCDVYHLDGTPFEADPRYILKKVLGEAKEMGYDFTVGPECEFFLFHTDEDGKPTTITHEEASYFDVGPLDMGENARRDIILTLEDMDFTIEESHHEIAPAQHEIEFQHGEALETADNIMTFKLAVKTVAKRHGLHATFMPKPTNGVAGSGMHINMALIKDGKNAFNDASDPNGLSELAYQFMAGIMSHIKGMTAVVNPIINSYKRLSTGFEAPVYIAWSTKGRRPLIRVPMTTPERARIELRSPDPTANPYLALALCLAAGLDGIKKKMTPPPAIMQKITMMTQAQREELGLEMIPRDLNNAIEEMQADELVMNTLGQELATTYIEAKKQEWNEYKAHVTVWELDHYLNKY